MYVDAAASSQSHCLSGVARAVPVWEGAGGGQERLCLLCPLPCRQKSLSRTKLRLKTSERTFSLYVHRCEGW